MRRSLLILALACVVALALLCGAGGHKVWADLHEEVILPGATDVRLNQWPLFRVRIIYSLPPGQTLHDLHRHLVHRGWRREHADDADETVLVFTRRRYSGIVLEQLTIPLTARDHRTLEIQVVRCLQVGGRVRCG
ncbi:MAG TPA: hypothetical protein VFU22_16750 [Roseiflexaceae bacterium]|nr:hypothetical protein [Roseiflexaceae bacterium]